MAQSGKQDDQVYVAILILFCVIAVLAILGPIGVAVALLTIVIGIIAGLDRRFGTWRWRGCCYKWCWVGGPSYRPSGVADRTGP